MTRRTTKAIGALVIACALAGTGARAAEWNGVDVTVREGLGDILRSDGAGPYVGNGDFSRISDRTEPDAQNIQDALWVQPWGKRRLQIQSPHVEGGASIECTNHNATVAFFDRVLNEDWFTTLQALPDGSSLPLEGNIRCATSSAIYYVDYPPYRPGGGMACGRVTRLDGRTYIFDVAANCLADVYLTRWVRGSAVETKIATAISAPFEMRAVLE